LAGAVVSRALAERFWPGEDPIGKGIKGNGNEPPYYRIVGVTGDVRAEGLDKAPTEVVYFPMMPATGTVLWSPPNYMTVVLRTRSTTPEALTGAVRRTLAQLDPEVPLANVRTMDDVVAKSTARVSFTMTLLGTASLMALVLSAVGLYGVLAYVVWLRTHEIGVRIALGAGGPQVRRLVVLQSARLAAVGLALGIAGAVTGGGVLRAFLFEVRPAEPLVLGATAALLAAVALLASYVPARRATRVDPMTALRAD
jgi:predicted lysophospholipase L1 biosynthesis ABC-type transport system permease subunit